MINVTIRLRAPQNLKKLERVDTNSMTFSDVVESIKSLSLDEKEEIQSLLAQFLREEGRENIYQNYLISKQHEREGKLKFSSDINELMQSLEN